MPVSVFDLFKIGIGPSSSHTVGPMRAAEAFAAGLAARDVLDDVDAVRVELYGSLAATGDGHGTPPAILAGLEGARPETVTADHLAARTSAIAAEGVLLLAGRRAVRCGPRDVVRHPLSTRVPHPNTLDLVALAVDGSTVAAERFFSVGGGAIRRAGETGDSGAWTGAVPFPFSSGAELLALAEARGRTIGELVRENELSRMPAPELDARLDEIARVMRESARSAMAREGTLPGGLAVRRRARTWLERLEREDPERAPERWFEWVSLIALAVNEENASGGRVVTAPTNGAAGIIPAVLHYATEYAAPDRVAVDVSRRFLLTAAAIGSLYKTNASISGAEMGCQGEVGVAASMAAGALAEILGATPRQVENAAEIAMEHHLGMTCDPVGGLVQIPCIERNAIAANKAINAAHMAMWGDGEHHVSLDQVVATMRATGLDMDVRYKETSLGGLAVNVVAC
jgi:L-serine dehydratase, iron-sulfur-dependent, single chain form